MIILITTVHIIVCFFKGIPGTLILLIEQGKNCAINRTKVSFPK